MRTKTATQQQSAIELAAAGVEPGEIAARLNCSTRTVRRYLADEGAKAMLREAQQERLQLLARQAISHAGPALATLRAIADDHGAADGARVSACRSLLDAALKLLQVADLDGRVLALEEACEKYEGGKL